MAQLAIAAQRHEGHHQQIEVRQRVMIDAEQRDGLQQIKSGGGPGIVAAIGQHDGQQLAEGEGHDDEMVAADAQRRDADDQAATKRCHDRRPAGSASQKPMSKSRARIAAV